MDKLRAEGVIKFIDGYMVLIETGELITLVVLGVRISPFGSLIRGVLLVYFLATVFYFDIVTFLFSLMG